MAHIKLKKPRMKRVKKPAPVPPPKPERPRRSELKSIYRDLLSSDVEQRVNTLARAMEWYDHCQAYVLHKQKGTLTLPQKKQKNAALKLRHAGIITLKSEIKEENFIKTIKYYEKMVLSYKPPLISKYLRRFSKEKKKLTRRKDKLSHQFKDFISLIKKSLNPKNSVGKEISIKVDKLSVSWRIDAEGNVTFDRKLLYAIKKDIRRHGLLAGVLQLLPVLSECAARTVELDNRNVPTGKIIVSNRLKYNAVMDMLDGFLKYCIHEPVKRLVRKPKPKKEKTDEQN